MIVVGGDAMISQQYVDALTQTLENESDIVFHPSATDVGGDYAVRRSSEQDQAELGRERDHSNSVPRLEFLIFRVEVDTMGFYYLPKEGHMAQRVSHETDLEYEVLRALDALDPRLQGQGATVHALLEQMVNTFWDFDQNDFQVTLARLLALGYVFPYNNETLTLLPRGRERLALSSNPELAATVR